MTTAQQRKQQERQARRRRIQRAAREVFAEKGYAKTSIEQVARHASLSVGAIYLYFRSKEDLYVSLLEETFELFDAELSAIHNRADLRIGDGLKAAWGFLSQWAVEDVEGARTLRLIAQPGLRKQLSDEVAEATVAGLTTIRRHLTGLVQKAIDAGEYRPGCAGETAELLWSMFLGLLQSNDVRIGLDVEGTTFTGAARNALAVVESSIRLPAKRVAEAA